MTRYDEEYTMDDDLWIDFRDKRFCEKCGHENCRCPRYIDSNYGNIMDKLDKEGWDVVIELCFDTHFNPRILIGQYYHAMDIDDLKTYVYRLDEYIYGGPDFCQFRARRIDEDRMLFEMEEHPLSRSYADPRMKVGKRKTRRTKL